MSVIANIARGLRKPCCLIHLGPNLKPCNCRISAVRGSLAQGLGVQRLKDELNHNTVPCKKTRFFGHL